MGAIFNHAPKPAVQAIPPSAAPGVRAAGAAPGITGKKGSDLSAFADSTVSSPLGSGAQLGTAQGSLLGGS